MRGSPMSDLTHSTRKSLYVVASTAMAVLVVLEAAVLLAPGLALLAVPFVVGVWLYRGRPRVAAAVISAFSLLVLTLVVTQLSKDGPQGWQDVIFDVVGGLLAVVGSIDGVRALVRGAGPADLPMPSPPTR